MVFNTINLLMQNCWQHFLLHVFPHFALVLRKGAMAGSYVFKQPETACESEVQNQDQHKKSTLKLPIIHLKPSTALVF